MVCAVSGVIALELGMPTVETKEGGRGFKVYSAFQGCLDPILAQQVQSPFLHSQLRYLKKNSIAIATLTKIAKHELILDKLVSAQNLLIIYQN